MCLDNTKAQGDTVSKIQQGKRTIGARNSVTHLETRGGGPVQGNQEVIDLSTTSTNQLWVFRHQPEMARPNHVLDQDITAEDIANIISACNQDDQAFIPHAPNNPNDKMQAFKLKQLVAYGSGVDNAAINSFLALCLCASTSTLCYLTTGSAKSIQSQGWSASQQYFAKEIPELTKDIEQRQDHTSQVKAQ